MTIETLSWNGFTYSVKPFNLDNLYALLESIATIQDGGRVFRDAFESSCKALLLGTTKESELELASGRLTQSVLTSEDVEKALEFKERIDFLSNSFIERMNALKKSAPDLTDKLVAKVQQVQRPKSQKDTKGAPAHSG